MLGLALGICASADVGSVCNPICVLTFYDWFYLSGTGLPRLVMEKRPLSGCSSSSSSNSIENKRGCL